MKRVVVELDAGDVHHNDAAVQRAGAPPPGPPCLPGDASSRSACEVAFSSMQHQHRLFQVMVHRLALDCTLCTGLLPRIDKSETIPQGILLRHDENTSRVASREPGGDFPIDACLHTCRWHRSIAAILAESSAWRVCTAPASCHLVPSCSLPSAQSPCKASSIGLHTTSAFAVTVLSQHQHSSIMAAGFPGVNSEFQDLVQACAEAALENNDSELQSKVDISHAAVPTPCHPQMQQDMHALYWQHPSCICSCAPYDTIHCQHQIAVLHAGDADTCFWRL